MGWIDIPEDERQELLKRRDSGEPVEDLASEIDMRPGTLSRRLRELAAGGRGNENKGPSLSFEEEGNYAKAKSISPRIRTLEELVAACKVDLEVWDIRDWGVKKWEVGARAQWKDLTFDQGRTSGYVKEQGIQVEELWSVWAKFARRNPIPMHPIIRPVSVDVSYRVIPVVQDSVDRSLVLTDPHFGFSREIMTAKLDPFHDRGVLDIALQIAYMEQPYRIYILGDFFDLVMWTDKFLRSPKFEYCTQPAICEGHWWLRQLREGCPSTEIIIHEGNHDARMGRSIIKHLRAAYGLHPADELDLPPVMTPARLLSLHNLDVEWIDDYPSDRSWINDSLQLAHGDAIRKGTGATARAVIENNLLSTVFGHSHRKELGARTIHTSMGRKTIIAYNPGCACRIDGAVPGATKMQDWHQGLAVIDHTEEMFSIYDVNILGGRAIWDGRIYEARDRLPDIKKDMPEWNW